MQVDVMGFDLSAGLVPSDVVVELGLIDLQPWQIIEVRALLIIYANLAETFLNQQLVPFAGYMENDDVVCWHPVTGKLSPSTPRQALVQR